MKKLSVDRAIRLGHQMVNYPLFAILIIGFILSVYFEMVFKKNWISLIGVISTLLLMFLWRITAISNWRIIAFQNCRNVHELKRRAIGEKLIWPTGSVFSKLEIATPRQKENIAALQRRFGIADKIESVANDELVSDETIIQYSRRILAFYGIAGVSLFLFGVYWLLNESPAGFVFVLLALFVFFIALKKTRFREPGIIINSEGIKTLRTEFNNWDNVVFIELLRKRIRLRL